MLNTWRVIDSVITAHTVLLPLQNNYLTRLAILFSGGSGVIHIPNVDLQFGGAVAFPDTINVMSHSSISYLDIVG